MAFLPKPSESTGDFVTPEPGVYTLEFTRFDGPKISPWDENKQVIDLFFEITDDDEYDGHEMRKTCGWTMHKTMSSLYPIVCALHGREIDDDEDVSLEDVVGTRVQGTITNTSKPSRNDPARTVTFANIDSVVAMRKRRSSTAKDNPFKQDEEAA